MTSNSYIKHLPNELLAKIFSAVEDGHQDLVWKLPSPALISSVCRHWQMLAQNTPTLWINILVPVHKSLEDCKRWITEWIARSGVLLISVILNDSMGNHWIWPHLSNIIDVLSPHSKRIRRIAIHSHFHTLASSALVNSLLPQLPSAPNLEQLTICSGNGSSLIQESPGQRQYSLDFPKLTTLKAEGLMVPFFSNLTSLSIRKLSVSYRAVSHLFTTSPGLKHLTLHDLMPLTTLPPPLDLIRADSLRSLAVSLLWRHLPEQPTYLFKYLAMPNIKYLELDGDAWKASDFGQSLSSAQIDTLYISNRSEQSPDTINFLHSFSTVRHLQLVHASTRGLLTKRARSLVRRTSVNLRPNAPIDSYNINAIQLKPPITVSVNAWPEVRTITLVTLTAGDMVNLCAFVTCHKHVQVVELSTSARRHLSSSLRRRGDTVYQRFSLFKAVGSEEGLNDVEAWLKKMVDIRVLRSPSVGLLHAD